MMKMLTSGVLFIVFAAAGGGGTSAQSQPPAEIPAPSDVKAPRDVSAQPRDSRLDRGRQLMVVGEKRRFWIPGALAYDNSPRPGVPKGMLVFDVELLAIR
jgi:FKBP-type peptidyl-prolyl cis-trans isomerase